MWFYITLLGTCSIPPWKIIVVPNWSDIHEITDSCPSNKVSPQLGRASPLLPFRNLYRKHQWFDIFGAAFIEVTPQGKKSDRGHQIGPILGESFNTPGNFVRCALNHSLFGLVLIWPLLQSRFIIDIWTEFVPVTWGFEVFYRCKGWRICFSQIPCTKRISYRCKDVQSWDSLWSRQKRTNIWISILGGFKYVFLSPLPGALIVKLRGLNFGGCRWKLSHILLYLFAGFWVSPPSRVRPKPVPNWRGKQWVRWVKWEALA